MELSKTADTTSGNSPMNALIAMFYEPSKTYAMLEPRRHAWLPLILVMVCSSVLLVWYFNIVDIVWTIDQMNAGVKDAAAREQASQMMTKGMLQAFSLGATWIGYPLVTALMGVYFMVIAKAMNKEFTFGTGFALAAWSSVPSLLLLPLGTIQILMSSNDQFSSSELNPFSVNQLFFQYPMNHALTAPLDMLSVTSFWGLALMIIGFQVWARVSRATAVKVVLIPYATLLGGWIAIAMAMSPSA